MWNAAKAVGLTLVIGTTVFAAGGCGDGAGSSDLPADCSALERPGGGAEAVPAGVLPAGMTWQWQITGAVEHGLDVSMYDVDLVDLYDGSLNEECLAYDECDAYRPFVDAGKVALHVEYLDAECDEASQIERVCGDPSREGFSTLVKEWDLGAWGVSCD